MDRIITRSSMASAIFVALACLAWFSGCNGNRSASDRASSGPPANQDDSRVSDRDSADRSPESARGSSDQHSPQQGQTASVAPSGTPPGDEQPKIPGARPTGESGATTAGDGGQEPGGLATGGQDDPVRGGSTPPVGIELSTPAAAAPVEEVWMAYYLGSSKIGHAVTRVYDLADATGQGTLKRTEMEQVITLLRNGDRVTQELRMSSLERAEGGVLRLNTSISDGGPPVTTEARRDRSQLHVVLKSPGSSSLQSLPWDDNQRGFFADQQVLSAKPLEPGGTCTFQSFIPVLNIVGETTLTARDWEEITTPFGRERLLRVDSLMVTEQLRLRSQLWCDEQGRIRKYFMPQGNMTAYRTVRELALADNVDVDLYTMINVTVAKPIADPHHLRQATYRARLRGTGDPARVFVSDGSQVVTPVDPSTVDIVVRRMRPEDSVGEPTPESTQESTHIPPDDRDRRANSLIQSDDSVIQQMAAEIASATADDWTWAVECERFVSRTIERKALTEAFASAAEVARSRTGDCTEHAVLTAALCRAHGIPARVATGLVAYQDIYAFHMWNEVWIKDRWIPIDATLGLGGIGVGHIKLGVSSLDGVSPFAALAPVLEVMGSLELEVLAYE